jgi:hypothetical protein
MARDIRVQVLLTPEEFLALSAMSDEDGDSQSGLLRRLMLSESRRRVESSMDRDAAEQTAGHTQLVRSRAA